MEIFLNFRREVILKSSVRWAHEKKESAKTVLGFRDSCYTYCHPAWAEYLRPVKSFPFSFRSWMNRQVRFSVPVGIHKMEGKILVHYLHDSRLLSPWSW